MIRTIWKVWWRFFCRMDEYFTWLVAALAIFGGVIGGGFVCMIAERLYNQAVGIVAWVVIGIIALALLFSVEYASDFCPGDCSKYN